MNQNLTASLGDVLAAVEQTGLFVSLCTIAAPPDPDTPGPLGQANMTDYVPIAGLTDIPCMLAEIDDAKPNPGYEMRQEEVIRNLDVKHCLLNRYSPTITPEQRATIDGVQYNILAAQSDSQRVMTRLAVRVYNL